MLLLWLAGCLGTFQVPDGTDAVRGALFFQPDATVPLAINGSRQAFLLVTNSTLPCAPKEEGGVVAAQDQKYWEAQVATAFAREGALAVAFTLAVDPTTDWLGRYELHADAWDADAMAGYVDTDGRVAAGAWFRVDETAVDETDGMFANFQIVDDTFDGGVGEPAWVDIERADEWMTGSFSFSPTHLSGDFRAERCDDLDLLAELYLRLSSLQTGAVTSTPTDAAL